MPNSRSDPPLPRLLIFSKVPLAGRVKTRLVPPLSHLEAAALSGAFLLDALESWSALPGIDLWLYVAGADEDPSMLERSVPSLFRSPLAERITIRMQSGEDLGERLHAAFEEAFGDGCTRACAIGSDHPTLPPGYIDDAFVLLSSHDLAIGPADDGGYYLLGLRELHRELLLDLPYSSPALFERVMAAAGQGDLLAAVLPLWYDVDDERSLARLRADRPLLPKGGRTAGVLETIDRRMMEDAIVAGAGDER
jgi:rSAM/selenodomain-associated transferase 1